MSAQLCRSEVLVQTGNQDCQAWKHGMGTLKGLYLCVIQWLVVGGSWSEVPVRGLAKPPARSVHAVVFDAANRLWMHGGGSDDVLSDLWAFDFDTNSWDQKQQLNQGPSPRGDHVAVWDEHRSAFWIHGGYDGVTYFSDLWRYSPSAFTWTNIPTSGPSARSQHVAVWDGTNFAMWIHGGLYDCTLNQDLWKFDVRAGSWSRMPDSGNQPSARINHVAAWDDTNRAIWIHAGHAGSPCGGVQGGLQEDLWRYDTTTGSWNLIYVGGPSPRSNHVAGWDPSNRALWIHGGFDGSFCRDLWRFEAESYQWQLITDSPAPSGRFSHAAAWHVTRTSLCIHGGYSEVSKGTLQSDFWCYTVTTTTTSQTVSSSSTSSVSTSTTLSSTFTSSSSTSTKSSTSSSTASSSSTKSSTITSSSTSSTSRTSTSTSSTRSSTSSTTESTTTSTTSTTFTSTTTASTTTTTSKTFTTSSTTSSRSSSSSTTTSTTTTISHTVTTTSSTFSTSTSSSTTTSTITVTTTRTHSTTMSTTTSSTSTMTLSTTTTSSSASTSSTISTSSTSRTSSTSISATSTSSTSITTTSSSSSQTTSTQTTRTVTTSTGTMTTSTSSTVTTTTTACEDLTAVYILCPLVGIAIVVTITWVLWRYLTYLRFKQAVTVVHPVPVETLEETVVTVAPVPPESPEWPPPWLPDLPPDPPDLPPPPDPPDPWYPAPMNLQLLHHPPALALPCPAHPGRSPQRPATLPDLAHLEALPQLRIDISPGVNRHSIENWLPTNHTWDQKTETKKVRALPLASPRHRRELRPTQQQPHLETPTISCPESELARARTRSLQPETSREQVTLPEPNVQSCTAHVCPAIAEVFLVIDRPCLHWDWSGECGESQDPSHPSSSGGRAGLLIDPADMSPQLVEVHVARSNWQDSGSWLRIPSLPKEVGLSIVCTQATPRWLPEPQLAPILNTPAQTPNVVRTVSDAPRGPRRFRTVSAGRIRARPDRRGRVPGPGFYNTEPDPNQFGWIPGRYPGFPTRPRYS